MSLSFLCESLSYCELLSSTDYTKICLECSSKILAITHTQTSQPIKISRAIIISLHLPDYKLILCPPGVYNCNVAPSLRCTGSSDIFPRSSHRLGGFGASLFKKINKCYGVKGGLCLLSQTFSSDKIRNSRRHCTGSSNPLRSAHFLTGDGSVLLRHHIATPKCKLTRKEFRIIYMWTGFQRQRQQSVCCDKTSARKGRNDPRRIALQ